jgi:hypothetical protein
MSEELKPCPFCGNSAATVYPRTCDKEKASKLYRAADFPRMRDAMVKHLMSLDRQEAA